MSEKLHTTLTAVLIQILHNQQQLAKLITRDDSMSNPTASQIQHGCARSIELLYREIGYTAGESEQANGADEPAAPVVEEALTTIGRRVAG